jgi:hypothetical protein
MGAMAHCSQQAAARSLWSALAGLRSDPNIRGRDSQWPSPRRGFRLNDFNAGTSNAEFLFGSHVLDYIERVRTRAVDLRTALVLSDEKQPDGEERTRNIKKVEADLNWLIEQSTAMTKVFAPYLGFANIKA